MKDEWKDLVNEDCPSMTDKDKLAAEICTPGFVYLEAPDVFFSVYRNVRHHCDIIQLPGLYWSLKLAFLQARSHENRKVIDSQ